MQHLREFTIGSGRIATLVLPLTIFLAHGCSEVQDDPSSTQVPTQVTTDTGVPTPEQPSTTSSGDTPGSTQTPATPTRSTSTEAGATPTSAGEVTAPLLLTSSPQPTVRPEPDITPTPEPATAPATTSATEVSTSPPTFEPIPSDTPSPTTGPTEGPVSPDPGVRLNEVACAGADWIEVINGGESMVDLGDYILTDSVMDPTHHYMFPPGQQLAPGELAVVAESDQKNLGLPFGIKCGDDDVTLMRSNGDIIDEVTIPASDEGVTWGRLPDGVGFWQDTIPTYGGPNLPVLPPDMTTTCQPTLTMERTNWLEGETIEMELRCASGEPLGSFNAALDGVPPGGAWTDDGMWRVETDLGTAARYDVEVTVKGPEGYTEHTSTTLWVGDAIDNDANLPVDPTRYTEEWGVPILYLEPSDVVGEEYVPTTITFAGKVIAGKMKLRGASSLYYPKNSFTLKFDSEDLDSRAYGGGKVKHLVLVSTFDDNSYVRQKLGYDLWADLSAQSGDERLSPRSFFSVVYLSGQWFGLYVAVDHIDDEFVEESGLSRDGNLYKSVNHDANFYLKNAYGVLKTTLHDGYTKKEGLPTEGEEGAFADLDNLVWFAATQSPSGFMDGASRWIRLADFMDWFRFVYFINAEDSGGKNAYLYNNPDYTEFRYCPWDLNHSFGQSWTTSRIPPDYWNDFYWANRIFSHFQSDPSTSQLLWSELEEDVVGGPMSEMNLAAHLEEYDQLIHWSAQRDWDHWSDEYANYWAQDHPDGVASYEEETTYLHDWISERTRLLLEQVAARY